MNNLGGPNYRVQNGCHNCKHVDQLQWDGPEPDEWVCKVNGDSPRYDVEASEKWCAENQVEPFTICDSWVDGDGW